jgi:hypothetical protein
MSEIELELAVAWEEVSFWQDFVVWWHAEHHKSPEPRVMEALENAWRRYEKALHLRRRTTAFESEPTGDTARQSQLHSEQ